MGLRLEVRLRRLVQQGHLVPKGHLIGLTRLPRWRLMGIAHFKFKGCIAADLKPRSGDLTISFICIHRRQTIVSSPRQGRIASPLPRKDSQTAAAGVRGESRNTEATAPFVSTSIENDADPLATFSSSSSGYGKRNAAERSPVESVVKTPCGGGGNSCLP